eukprot:scaffold52610_cov68-Phaeocystis_antarctica.AAC.6
MQRHRVPQPCRTYGGCAYPASGVLYVPRTAWSTTGSCRGDNQRTVCRTTGSGAFNDPLSRNDPFVRLLHEIRTCVT